MNQFVPETEDVNVANVFVIKDMSENIANVIKNNVQKPGPKYAMVMEYVTLVRNN